MNLVLQSIKSVFRGVYNAIEASKTHWDTRREEPVEYTFDGNIEGKTIVQFDEGMYFVKVADNYPIDAPILKFQTVNHDEWIDEDTGEKQSEDYEESYEMGEGDSFWEEIAEMPGGYFGWCGMFYAERDIEPSGDFPGMPKGLYFPAEYGEDWCYYLSRIKFVLAVGELKKLDAKYLPDNLATVEDVEAAKAVAESAQATADNAQTTADNARATAESAQTTAEQQADWNESNADSVSYVKNRTHSMKYVAGDALTKRIVLYPESRAVVIESASNENIAYSLVNFTESAGIKFHSYSNYNPLTYDGLDKDGNHVYRASISWNNVTARFVISKDLSEVKIYAYTTSNVGNPEVDIKWAAVEEEITPLPEKYIPDSIARKADVRIPPMTPATADEDGASGLVPAPAAGQQDMVLYGDGTWRAVEGGGGSGGGLKRAARVVTTENAVSLSVTGLSVKLPATIALYNPGNATNVGAMLTVNGVRKGMLGGSMSQNNNQRPGNKFWFAETETSTMNCYMMLANNTFGTVDFGKAPETINTVVIEPAYAHDGETKYFQSGTIIEIYEGVFPNV